jgi:hypothetical protein
MDYPTARPLIQDGDTIAVRERLGVLALLTRIFTRSPVTHVGVALWMDGGLWMAELNGGKNHAIPLSQLEGTDFDVYDPPLTDRQALRAATVEALRLKIAYGSIALVVIGVLNWLRIRIFLHARRLLVCSGYCIMIYENAGWAERSRIESPAELVAQLKIKLQVRALPKAEPVGSSLGSGR